MYSTQESIASFDPELSWALERETQRQEDHIELIASENYASPLVLAAQGSNCVFLRGTCPHRIHYTAILRGWVIVHLAVLSQRESRSKGTGVRCRIFRWSGRVCPWHLTRAVP